MYQAALHNPSIHAFEHICFFAYGALMWSPVVETLPGPEWFGTGFKLGYIAIVRLFETAFGNVFLWSGTVFYPYYVQAHPRWGITPLHDQALAGTVMMIEGSLVTIAALAWLFLRLAARRASCARSCSSAGSIRVVEGPFVTAEPAPAGVWRGKGGTGRFPQMRSSSAARRLTRRFGRRRGDVGEIWFPHGSERERATGRSCPTRAEPSCARFCAERRAEMSTIPTEPGGVTRDVGRRADANSGQRGVRRLLPDRSDLRPDLDHRGLRRHASSGSSTRPS